MGVTMQDRCCICCPEDGCPAIKGQAERLGIDLRPTTDFLIPTPPRQVIDE
jgi:hypothetical protein